MQHDVATQKHQGKKLHQRVSQRIMEDAARLNLGEGDKLPSIRQLSRRYEVSVAPVRRAVEELKRRGLVESRSRGGIYLTDSHRQQPSSAVCHAALGEGLPFGILTRPLRSSLQVALVDHLPAQQRMWKAIVAQYRLSRGDVDITLRFGADAVSSADRSHPVADIIQMGPREARAYASTGQAHVLPESLVPHQRIPSTAWIPGLWRDLVYSVPLCIHVPVMMVNQELLQSIGTRVNPTSFTFSEFVAACHALNVAKATRRISQDVMALSSQVNPFLYLAAFSDCFFDPVVHRFDWHHEDVLRFFTMIAEVTRGPDEIGKEWAILWRRFCEGKSLFAAGFPIALRDYPSFALPVQFPIGESGIVLHGATYHAVPKTCPQPVTAMEFVAFLASEEVSKLVTAEGFIHPCTCQRPVASPLQRAEHSSFRGAESCLRYGEANYDFIMRRFWRIIDSVREGVLAPREAMRLLADSYNHHA